jgi:uncharacterized membrane protein
MIPAQNFDIFGLIGFVILFFIGIKILKEKKLRNLGYLVLLISLIGFIVDCYSVITNFILP